MLENVEVKNVTASGVIKATPGEFVSATLAAGSDSATLILYDNATEASGTIICNLAATAGMSASWYIGGKTIVKNGIYAATTGTAESATVAFK